VSPLRHELGSYIPEDDILQSHRRENFKCYIFFHQFFSNFYFRCDVTRISAILRSNITEWEAQKGWKREGRIPAAEYKPSLCRRRCLLLLQVRRPDVTAHRHIVSRLSAVFREILANSIAQFYEIHKEAVGLDVLQQSLHKHCTRKLNGVVVILLLPPPQFCYHIHRNETEI
jgi:hypothetical protein